MTRAQFLFSLGSGAILMTLGATLATGGTADWGLFWVGGIISALAITDQVKNLRLPAALTLRKPLAPALSRES